MRKLLRGILDFRSRLEPERRERFAELALGQQPDALFIACSDSRVVPNEFASTEPGDLFVVRNVGNMVPACLGDGRSDGEGSEVGAIEFALVKLEVTDLIVCGHSECGAMQALCAGELPPSMSHLATWLRHGEPALQRLGDATRVGEGLAKHNRLSQLNVLEQLAHLSSYPLVRSRVEEGRLQLHGWWFDIAKAEVSSYSEAAAKFVVIDEAEVRRLEAAARPRRAT